MRNSTLCNDKCSKVCPKKKLDICTQSAECPISYVGRTAGEPHSWQHCWQQVLVAPPAPTVRCHHCCPLPNREGRGGRWPNKRRNSVVSSSCWPASSQIQLQPQIIEWKTQSSFHHLVLYPIVRGGGVKSRSNSRKSSLASGPVTLNWPVTC